MRKRKEKIITIGGHSNSIVNSAGQQFFQVFCNKKPAKDIFVMRVDKDEFLLIPNKLGIRRWGVVDAARKQLKVSVLQLTEEKSVHQTIKMDDVKRANKYNI